MHGELERDSASVADPVFHALGELQVVPIARHEITAALSDADDWPIALELGPSQAVVEVPLQVQRGHLRVVRIVEPRTTAQAFPVPRLGHELPPVLVTSAVHDAFLTAARGRSRLRLGRGPTIAA